ncbi:unnamed protein product [Paramecium sonneborni]|uniref:Uncharacterized protein n=1 Tax=Paramecium sonneborni TaxID=65129 RepID=A0A8S1Q5I8_9CILI|nr:unnamed protein product [Paramecium sonneborni]
MEKINQLSLDELAEQVLHTLGIIQDPNQSISSQKPEDKMLISIQLPLEVKNKQQIKILQTNLQKELEQGYIYLNEQEILALDQEIQKSLQAISFKERKILIKNQEFTMTSPFCVQTNVMPLNMARQWHYFKNLQSVQVYMIQAQLFFFFNNSYKIILIDKKLILMYNSYTNHMQINGLNQLMLTNLCGQKPLKKSQLKKLKILVEIQYNILMIKMLLTIIQKQLRMYGSPFLVQNNLFQ